MAQAAAASIPTLKASEMRLAQLTREPHIIVISAVESSSCWPSLPAVGGVIWQQQSRGLAPRTRRTPPMFSAYTPTGDAGDISRNGVSAEPDPNLPTLTGTSTTHMPCLCPDVDAALGEDLTTWASRGTAASSFGPSSQ